MCLVVVVVFVVVLLVRRCNFELSISMHNRYAQDEQRLSFAPILIDGQVKKKKKQKSSVR